MSDENIADGLAGIANAISGVSALKAYTVATLPAASLGQQALVTDATAPTYLGTLTGSGTVKCPVYYDGTVWRSH